MGNCVSTTRKSRVRVVSVLEPDRDLENIEKNARQKITKEFGATIDALMRQEARERILLELQLPKFECNAEKSDDDPLSRGIREATVVPVISGIPVGEPQQDLPSTGRTK